MFRLQGKSNGRTGGDIGRSGRNQPLLPRIGEIAPFLAQVEQGRHNRYVPQMRSPVQGHARQIRYQAGRRKLPHNPFFGPTEKLA
jgi:hypothetical protein